MATNMNLSTSSFLHHGISRMQTEELLLAAEDDGSFLLRESETVKNAYTMCILYQGRVHQYRVLPDENGRLYVQAEKGVQQRRFVDLIQLVHEYLHRGDNNGLACALRFPIPPAPPPVEEKPDSDEEIHGSMADYAEVMTPEPNCENAKFPDYSSETSHPLTKHMVNRFSQLDLSTFDGGFVSDLRSYVDSGMLKDSEVALSGDESLPCLRSVLASSARDLERQVELFLGKVDALRHLFGPITTPPLVSPEKLTLQRGKQEVNLPVLMERLNVCRSAVSNLEKKAVKKFEELSELPSEEPTPPSPLIKSLQRSDSVHAVIPPIAFEAKLIKHGKNTKVKLTVDIQSGKLFCVKPSKEILDSSNVFSHNKVEQLIKNTSNKTRLDIKIEGKKKESYMFDNFKERENFCQLMQQLKNLHSVTQEVENISIFIGSWNMAYEPPPSSLSLWLTSQGLGKTRCPTVSLLPHDLYVIGTQESGLTEKEWTNKIKSALMEKFSINMHTVAVVSLWSIRIVILVKTEYRHKISNVQHSSVKTGIANALGNKGAVGVSFAFNGTSLCFINAHLTSGNEHNVRRNQNFHDIIKGLNLGPKGPRSVFDITNQFHHLFFLGDLNYRIDGMDPVEVIKAITEDKNYAMLLDYDQLTINRKGKQSFVGFSEEEITFPPTYRIEKDTVDKYIWQKQKKGWVRINCPSWCDRVLWRSYPETYIRNVSYGCVETMFTSDHKPVFAAFDLGIITQFASAKGAKAESNGDMKLIFTEIRAEVNTSCRDHFLIEIQSPCLEDTIRTAPNKLFEPYKHNMSLPKWSASELPQLQPLFDDREYIEDQHLLLAVKSADGLESYGECVLALKASFSPKPRRFFASLIHLGEETGRISGLMHVKAREGSTAGLRTRRTRRSYELVYMDTDTLWAMDRERDDPHMTSSSNTVGKTSLHHTSSLDSSCSRNHQSLQSRTSLTATEPPKKPLPEPPRMTPNSGAVCKKPQQPRKPRLGQSSLGQNRAVPPTGQPPTAAPRAHIRPADGPPLVNSNNLPDIIMRSDVTPPVGGATGGQDVLIRDDPRRAGVGESVMSVRDNPLYGDEKVRMYSTLEDMRKNKRESQIMMTTTTPDDDDDDGDDEMEPPTPPPRKYNIPQSPEEEYAVLKNPETVNEWLLHLGLPQYIPVFLDNGWDRIEFIMSITLADLEASGVIVTEHRQRIYKSLQDMKNSSDI